MKSRIMARTKKNGALVPDGEFCALGKNIGAEGILFISEKKLAPGTKLDMKIDFPDDRDSLTIDGEVRWCVRVEKLGERPEFYDTGVRFLTLDKNHLRMLIKYVCGNMAEDLLKDIGE